MFAWLVRLARIDFGAEFEAVTGNAAIDVGVPNDIAKQLGEIKDLVGPEGGKPKKRAVLFKVTFPNAADSTAWHGRVHCWMLYLRSTTLEDEPADVRNYQQTHPDFPNETTLDQFFNEPQWESLSKAWRVHRREGVYMTHRRSILKPYRRHVAAMLLLLLSTAASASDHADPIKVRFLGRPESNLTGLFVFEQNDQLVIALLRSSRFGRQKCQSSAISLRDQH